nr:TRAP transporter substrate-binding protein DctP [Pseudomonas sp.]
MLKLAGTAFSAALAAALVLAPGASSAKELVISAALSKPHIWVGSHMDPFADAIEKETDITFTRYYAGELVSLGRELDGLQSGTIDVSAPMLAPYHEGMFPLSDISQLPTFNTNSASVTRAFQKLLDSDVELKDGKTFYEYELGSKGLRAWALGASGPYALSTTGKEITSPADLKGMPMRAGSALHTMAVQQLGATPVTLPSAQAYEALSRGTINGMVSSIGDWKSYSFQEILKYTITGMSIGNWESYLAMTDATWKSLTDKEREIWDRIARETADRNAAGIDQQDIDVQKASEAAGGKFVDIKSLPQEMQDHMTKATSNTWIQWIEQTEKAGHPAKAAAKLWAQLILDEGGALPQGAAQYLDIKQK